MKFTKHVFSVLVFCSGVNPILFGQTWDWVETIRPGGNEYCWDVANDIEGSVLATGRVKGSSTFGSGVFVQSPPPISTGETDVFVAKYMPNGDLLWVKRDGGQEADWGRAIISDDDGNVFVTGDYCDTANFGTHQIIATGTFQNRNVFLAKYDSSGTCLWAKSAGNAAGYSRGYGVTTDSLGNSYITGHISGISNFDGINFGITGKNIPFVAKFSASGTCIWVKHITVQYNGEGNDIKLGKDGNIVVVGGYKGVLTINSINYPGNSPSWADVFVIKMDPAGNFLWTSTAIGAFQDQANAIDFDSNNDIYIAGTFANDLTFGTTTINSLGWGTTAAVANARADGFIAKYTEDGFFVWVKTIRNSVNGLSNDLTLNALSVTNSSKILVGGSVWGNVDLDGVLLSLDTIYESGLITSFDTSGNVLWYKITGGLDSTYFAIRGVSSDSNNNYYVGGEFSGNPSMTFDSIITSSLNGFDGLIAKLSPPLDPVISADTLICPGQNGYFNVVQDGYPISYQWDFPGGVPTTSSLADPIINYPVAGTYIATLVIANGHQTDTIEITVLVTPAACSTSAPEHDNSLSINIFPNPVYSTATINLIGFDFQKDVKFQLYNCFGQEIGIPISVKENEFILNVETISPGGYFFSIIQDNSLIKTAKLLILNRQ